MPTLVLSDDECRQVISALAMQHPLIAKVSAQMAAQFEQKQQANGKDAKAGEDDTGRTKAAE